MSKLQAHSSYRSHKPLPSAPCHTCRQIHHQNGATGRARPLAGVALGLCNALSVRNFVIGPQQVLQRAPCQALCAARSTIRTARSAVQDLWQVHHEASTRPALLV